MKLVNILCSIGGVLSLLMAFYGFYLALNNFMKDWTLFIIFLLMFIVGVAGLIAFGTMLVKKNKGKD